MYQRVPQSLQESENVCTPLSTTGDTKIEYLAPVTKQYEPPSNFGNHPNFHRPSKRNKSHHRRNLAQNVPPQSFFHSLQTTLIRLRNNWVGKTETTRLLSSMQQTAVSGGPPRTKFFVPESAQPEKQFISVGVWAWKFRRPGPSSSARLGQPGLTWGRFGIDFPLWRESSYSGLPSWERVRNVQAKCSGRGCLGLNYCSWMLPFAGCLGVEFKDVGRMVCFVLDEMERDEVKTFMKDYGQKP